MWKKYIARYAILSLLMAQSLIAAEFIRGADISIQTRQDTDGVTYYEYGVPSDILSILQNHDFGWIRLRLFHSPQPGIYGVETMDLDYVTALATRVKAAGFKFLLDLHYSDTWADPGNQWKPAAWENLSQSELETAVHDYTRDVISHLRNNGVMPEMVQIGNETSSGMLWPTGNINGGRNWAGYTALINAGIEGVNSGRASEAMPEIMIHFADGGYLPYAQYFFENIVSYGVDFDVIGLSFYPEWHGSIGELTYTVNGLAQNFTQDIVIAEIGEYYTDNGGATGKSHEGQKQFIEDVIYLLENAPNGRGRGAFAWEPTWLWSSTDGYRALFQPSINQWGSRDWNDVEMTMGMEAFNISRKYSTWDTKVTGTVGMTSGNSVNATMMDSHKSDNFYETITEVETDPDNPSNNSSELEHKWSFNNYTTTGKVITFNVEAHHSGNSEGDDFIFAYSLDGTNFIDMLTVTHTTDPNSVQSYTLPADTDSWIKIRVMDADRSAGNTSLDTLYIDDMYISLTDPEPVSYDEFVARYAFESDAQSSVGSYHGTLAGTSAYTTGKYGLALDLNGTDAYVTLPTETIGSTDITIATWVNWDGGGAGQRIFDFGSDTNHYLFLSPDDSEGLRFAIKNGGTEELLQSTALPVDTWTHVAVTLADGTGKLYVNGTLVDTNNSMNISPADILPTNNYIGDSQFTADPFFDGQIDECLVFSRELDASEIRFLADAADAVSTTPASFATWAAAEAFPVGQDSSTANPDGDAHPNAIEWLFGTDPQDKTSTAPLPLTNFTSEDLGMAPGKTYLGLTARVLANRPGTTLTPEAGATISVLGTAPAQANVTQFGPAVADGDFESITWYYDVAVEDITEGTGFMRLKVTID